MPTTQIDATAMADTYDDVKRMLNKLAWRYCDRRKRDFADFQAVANLAFTKAYRSYDPKQGASFITWAWHCADGALRSHRNKMVKQYANEKQFSVKREPAGKHRHLYDRVSSELSDDALLVLRLIADSPGELARYFRFAKRNPRKARYAIRLRLRDDGWLPARMVDAFEEIREVM